MKRLGVHGSTHFPRSGFTLVELSAVTVISAVLMGVAVAVILFLEKYDTRSVLNFQHTKDFARLADRFRTDAHQSNSVRKRNENEPESLLAVLVSPAGNQIEYQLLNHELLRRETTSEGEWRQDRFLLPKNTTAWFEIENPRDEIPKPEAADTQVSLAKLGLQMPIQNKKGEQPQVIITAQVAKHLPVHWTQKGDDRADSE